MDKKIKILFITHHFLNGTGGGCFASRAYINAFAELFDDVTLFYPYKNGYEAQFINPNVRQIPVTYNKPKILKLWDLLAGTVHRYTNIPKMIGTEKYDIVVFDTSIVSFRLIDYFKKEGSKIIVIHHNYQYEYFRDNTKFPVSVPTLYWCKRYEGEAVRKADLNLTLTNQDAVLLRSHYSKSSETFKRLGVFEYEKKEHVLTRPKTKNHTFVFAITGTLSAYQTYESLYHWFETYYPVFKDKYPNSQLIIAGRKPGKDLLRLTECKNNVTVIANPASMDEILDQADFYICPTELGGGLKLRIMDGLSHGLPVITHKVSARGYDEFEEKGYLFSYDSEKSFRECLEKIASKTFRQEEIIKTYTNIFSFETGVERLRRILSMK